MPTQTATDSQAELVTLLSDALDDVHVGFAGSAERIQAKDFVFVLGVRNYSRSRGEQYMVEAYDLAVHVYIIREGKAQAALDADTRRWELIDAVDDVLRRDDFRGYKTRGGDLGTSEESLDVYDKGWVASTVATFSIEQIVQG